MHDEALLIQWQARGDADAFRTLTQRYGRMVYAAALRVLRNPTDAEDVAQDCFEKLAGARRAPDRYLGPWLHRIAVNRALDRLRVDAARKRREIHYAETSPPHAVHEWPDIYPLVDEAINTLPDKLRRVVVAHYLEGLTHEAIAERESVTRSAVTQRIQRGLEQVRTQLRRKGVIAPAAGIFAGMLGENMAQAAAIPMTLAENLGRMALAGPVAQGAGTLVGLVWLKYVAMGLAAASVVAVGSFAIKQNMQTNVADPEKTQQTQIATTQTSLPSPVESANGDSRVSAPRSAAPALAGNASGTTGSVSGHVFDRDTGAGIPNVDMMVASQSEQHETQTDENGAFSMDGLAPGLYHVICRRANGHYIPIEKREEAFDEFGRKVTVEAGQHYDIPGITLGRGESYSATVVAADGKPVSGALVIARTEIRNHRITNTARSGEDGRFCVSGFPSTTTLYVWAEKGTFVAGIYGPYALPQAADTADSLELEPEAIVRGTVVDEAGRGVAGLRVVPQFALHEAKREVEAVSDPQGHFELKGMFAGTLLLRVCRDIEMVNVGETPSLTLAAGEVVEGQELVVRVGDLSISGVVVDQRGNPVPRARIRCFGNGHDTYPWADGQGRFAAENLQPGVYTVSAEHENFLDVALTSVSAGSVGVRLVMPDAVAVRGRIIDAKTKQPVTEYKIKYCYQPDFMFLDQRYQDTQSEDGAFHLAVAQRGDVRIAVRAKGYLLGYKDVHIEEGMAPLANVEIRLDPQTDLTGTVHDESGKAIAGALVFSGVPPRPDDGDSASSRTDRNGQFVLPAEKLAHDAITIVHPDYPRTAVDLEPRHIAGEPIDVQISAGATLNCTFLRDGTPCPDVGITLMGRTGIQDKRAAANGKAAFTGLQDGLYQLICWLPSDAENLGLSLTENLSIESGESVEFIRDFQTGDATLWGRVHGEADWVRAELILETDTGTQCYMQSSRSLDSVWEYAFPDLPAGPAILKISYGIEEDRGGSMSKRIETTVVPAVATEQSVVLDGGGSIHGLLGALSSDEAGRVYVLYGEFTWEDWEMGRYDMSRDFCANLPVKRDGSFGMAGFQPHVYTLLAFTYSPDERQGFVRRTSAIIHFAGDDTEVSMTLH